MLLERLPEDTFVTAFLAMLSPRRGCATATRGTCPPLHVSGTGVGELPGHGVPLGVESSPGYRERERRLDPGDLLFAYTDGLTEARREGEVVRERAPGPAACRAPPRLPARAAGPARARRRRELGGRADRRCSRARLAPEGRDRRALRLNGGVSDSVYARAGVDQAGAGSAVRALVDVLARHQPRPRLSVGAGSGHYASVLSLDDTRGLALSCDGVGTKVIVAEKLGRLDTVGIDCIAMNVNDVICVGADPIAVLDYIAVEEADPAALTQIARGAARGRGGGGGRDTGRGAGGAARADSRSPDAPRVRPARLLCGAGGPGRGGHRGGCAAGRRHHRAAVERGPLQRAHARSA